MFTRPRFSIPACLGLAALALGTQFTLGSPTAHAAQDALAVEAASDNNNYRLFYDKLADQGDWFQTDNYGYAFQPRVAATDKTWRPYTDGYWAQTESGWTWVSNEDFGWACYHYGRWANVVDVGWVWVPGSDWSPAYVSWRVSKDHKHIGWAALPPEAVVTRTEGVEGWADSAYDIGPEAYNFIDADRFGENSYRGHLLPGDQNVALIADTENVTRVSYRNVESRTIIYDGGPDVTVIREATGHPVRELRLETRPENVEFFQSGDRRRITEVNGNSLIVATAAPEVITSTSIRISEPAHINRRLTSITVDRGYRGIRDPQEIERVRATLRSQSPPAPPQIQQRAAAAIRRDGAAVPFEQQGNRPPGPRNEANVPTGRNEPLDARQPNADRSRNEAIPAAPASPAPKRPTPERAEPNPRNPEAAPGVTPAHAPGGAPAATPEGTPEKGERERGRGKTTPEASPAPHAPATPENAREDRPEKHAAPATEASPTPRTKADKPEKAAENTDGERTRPSVAKEHESEKQTPKAADRSNPTLEPAAAAPSRRTSEQPEKKPAKPEAEPAQRQTPEAGKEKSAENSGRERTEKKEAPAAPSADKAKATPQP